MHNSNYQTRVQRTKKAVFGRLKLITPLAGDISNNETLHDIFTIVLIVTAIVLIIVL